LGDLHVPEDAETDLEVRAPSLLSRLSTWLRYGDWRWRTG
jgi:hypothetical protein